MEHRSSVFVKENADFVRYYIEKSMRYKLLTLASLLIGGILLGPAVGRAQFDPTRESGYTIQPGFVVDHARFTSDEPGHVRLEVYYQVYNFGLKFRPRGGNVYADYTVQLYVDHDDRQVARDSRTREITVANMDAARSTHDFRTSQFNVDLPPDDYKVKCILVDEATGDLHKEEFKVDLKLYDERAPQLSDVEFVQSAEKVDDRNIVFDKGQLRLVPSVSRSFGGTDINRMLYYMEIYRGTDSLDKVVVETKLRHDSKGMVYRDTLTTELDSQRKRQLREISLAGLPPGDYELEVYLRGRRNKKLHHSRHNFTVEWSVEGLLANDFKTALRQLSYIAEPGEIDNLEEKETFEDRVRAFNEFWEARDVTVGTARNEVKEEFYRRVSFADRRFRVLNRDGWRTDRGRIYITYGEPDQIDDNPMSLSSPPYQIWHYYRDGNYRRFAFLDENNDGDYRLLYPFDGLNQRPDF